MKFYLKKSSFMVRSFASVVGNRAWCVNIAGEDRVSIKLFTVRETVGWDMRCNPASFN